MTVDVLPFLLTFLKISGILVVAVDEHLLELRRLDERRFFTRIISYVQMPCLMTDNGSLLDLYPKSPPASDLFKTSTSENTVILEYCLDNVPNLFPGSVEQKMWLKFENDLQLKPQPLKKLCRGILRNAIRSRFEHDYPDLKKQYFAEVFLCDSQNLNSLISNPRFITNLSFNRSELHDQFSIRAAAHSDHPSQSDQLLPEKKPFLQNRSDEQVELQIQRLPQSD